MEQDLIFGSGNLYEENDQKCADGKRRRQNSFKQEMHGF